MANCIRCGRQLPPFSFKKICQWCVRHEAAQRGEDDDRQPVITQPWARRESSITVTHVLVGANVAVFIAMIAASANPGAFIDPTHQFSPQISVHFGANYGPLTLNGSWWRLFTYMFLHGSLLHIGFNMWCLWDLGRLCESLYGRWSFAAIYFVTGLAGGVASVAWNPGTWSVGASGAIFGLAGALIASFYLGEFSLPRFAIQSTLKSLLFFAGFNLIFGFVVPGIDNSAHIGGLISGLAFGALVARMAPESDAPKRRATVIGIITLAVVAAGLGVIKWRGASMRLAQQYQELMEKGDTIGRFQMILKQQPNSVPARLALAGAYFNQQKFPQAEAEYKHVLSLDPGNISAKFELGLTYLNEKRPQEAQAAFTDLLAQDSAKAQAHYGLGLVLEDQGKCQTAIEEFKTVLLADPSAIDVHQEIGNCYLQLNRHDDAIAAYSRQKEAGSDTPELENGLARAYQAKGMTKEAEEAKERALKLRGSR